MPFYSHAKDSENGLREGSKLLRQHINGVVEKCHQLHSSTSLYWDEQVQLMITDVAQFHDLGKYTAHFQAFLLESGDYNYQLKQHAKFGAICFFNKWHFIDDWKALLGWFLIVHHHRALSRLSAWLHEFNPNKSDNYAIIFKKQLQSLSEEANDEMCAQHGVVKSWLDVPEGFSKVIKVHRKQTSIDRYFQTNYCFSLLIEADKLDASDTGLYERKSLSTGLVDQRLAGKPLSLRSEVRTKVLARLAAVDLEQDYIFTLTAPTGIGKTLTALDAALQLRRQLETTQRTPPLIVYALPFINIIEQGLLEYEQTLRDNAKVLAHYQFADMFGKDELLHHGRDAADSVNSDQYNRRRMELNSWQSDVVITSFVQLLETLIGYRNKMLLKFNHLAGAILIMDEVQTLALRHLPLVGAALYYLTRFMRTRIILMTATKPKLMPLAHRHILYAEGENTPEVVELLPEHAGIYAQYRRTAIYPLLEAMLEAEDDFNSHFIERVFAPRWSQDQACLLVVNTVQRSIDLFDMLQQWLIENHFKNPVYCLSTNIVPAQRNHVINRIKSDLNGRKAPLLVATQCVEAGVDLNFDMGFRDLGPIDSLVQVAGRINREADPMAPEVAHKPLYVVEFEDCQKIYGTITAIQSRKALKEKNCIKESEYLSLVDTYFDDVADRASFKEAQKIFEGMKRLEYDEVMKSDISSPVSDFKVIEERGNVDTVFVNINEESEKALAAFEAPYKNKNNDVEFKRLKTEYEVHYKRLFHQYTIAVPMKFTHKLSTMDYADIKLALKDDYSVKTGLLRTEDHGNKDFISAIML